MVKHINESEFESEVLSEEGVVVVDFFATWCGPCKMLSPILEQVEWEMENVKIVKVDVDENPGIAGEYGVQSIPTIKVFKGGEDVSTNVGFLPKDALVQTINQFK